MRKTRPRGPVDLDQPDERERKILDRAAKDPALSVTVDRLEGESFGDWKRREAWAKDEARAKSPDPYRHGRHAPWFSTGYACDWGKEQGWRLLQREGFDARTNRSHDLPLGSDAMFATPGGIVYVQGAGKNQRPEHWERFEERGGAALARQLRVGFVYIEFKRDQKEPLTVEWWVPLE